MTSWRHEVPAEIAPVVDCDCYWHRRVFVHITFSEMNRSFISLKAMWNDRFDESKRMPLARTLQRINRSDGSVFISLQMRLDGTLIEVTREVWPVAADVDGVAIIQFLGWIGPPLPDGSRRSLVPANDHSRRLSNGGDPTLMWRMPAGAGTLVVWPESWWWHLVDLPGVESPSDSMRDPLAALDLAKAIEHGWDLASTGRDVMSLPAEEPWLDEPVIGESATAFPCNLPVPEESDD